MDNYYKRNLIIKSTNIKPTHTKTNYYLSDKSINQYQIIIERLHLKYTGKNLNYDIQFVCFDSVTWIGNGRLIPSGPLRENLSSLKKYDAIFLKTHNKNNVDDLIHSIKKINHQIKIFKVFYKILNLDQFDLNEKYFAFSGIGNPSSFEDLLIKNNFNVI